MLYPRPCLGSPSGVRDPCPAAHLTRGLLFVSEHGHLFYW